MPMHDSPHARPKASGAMRNAILIAAVIEGVVLIPALFYLIFWSGR